MSNIYYELSHPQKRIWYTEKMFPNTSIHTIGGLMRIHGKLDMSVFIESIKTVVKMSDSIRMRFVEIDEVPYQYPHPYIDEYVEYVDLSWGSEECLQEWQREIMHSAFTLIDSPLCHFYVYKLNESESGFLLKTHHIIADGWSTDIIEKQIISIYESTLKGEVKKVDVIYSYTEYLAREAQYLNSRWAERDRKFWNDRFQFLPDTMIPSKVKSTKGRREKYILSSAFYNKLKQYLKEFGISLPVFFTAANLLYIYIARCMEDIIIGIPIYNRSGFRDKNTIGMYTSTMPFRFQVNRNSTLSVFLADVNSELSKFLRHQKYPYDLLVKEIELRKKGFDSLFDTCVNCYNTNYISRMNELEVMIEEVYSGDQSYPLQIVLDSREDSDELCIYADFILEKYTTDDIRLMIKHLIIIMENIMNEGNMQVMDFCLYDRTAPESEMIQHGDSVEGTLNGGNVIELLEQQAAKNPDKYAILEGNRYIMYGELYKNINKRAAYFVRRGLKPGDIIAVLAENSTELIETILAILKSGGIYLPIDRIYPRARIKYMLMDASPRMLYTNLKDVRDIFDGDVIYENEICAKVADVEFENLSKSDSIAYIIYTSGSTGNPKGVMVSHASLLNYVSWARKEYMKKNDIFAFFTSISFDLTITSLFVPLASGNAIDIYRDSGDGFVLHNIIHTKRATIIKMTPSHLSLIQGMDNRNSSIRSIIVGGENLTSELAYGASLSFGHNVEIINEYGPTEATVGCMIYRYNHRFEYGVSVPIGLPADNVSICLMDSNQNPLPEGCVGEIYIGGSCLAEGYLNNQKLTETSFVCVKMGQMKGQLFYRTGDIARKLPNGNYVFLGRKDEQLKIRGFRIEPAEIVNALLGIEGIWQAAVKLVENERGNKILCAYLSGEVVYSKDEMDIKLKRVLPTYMLPSQYIYLDTIPLTTNGKIDIARLPATIMERKEYQFDAEEVFPVRCFKEVLNIDKIDMEDNFFSIGGDSIKAIQISARLREYGYYLNVNDLTQCRTIGDALCMISKEKQVKEGNNQGYFSKTPIIDWFFRQNMFNDNYYNQSVFIELNRNTRETDFSMAIRKLVSKHPSLRMNYNKELGLLFYNNNIEPERAYVGDYNLSHCQLEEVNACIARICTDIKQSFDITGGIMFKAALIRVKERVYVFLTAHHLAVDGLSWRILLEDLNALLEEIYSGLPASLPLSTSLFSDWAEALEGRHTSRRVKDFWVSMDKLAVSPCVNPSITNSEVERRQMIFKMELDSYELRKLANDCFRLHMDELFIIALAMCMACLSGTDSVPMMIEHHGRHFFNGGPDISRTVGWFTLMYPVCLNIGSMDLTENIKNLKEVLRKIPENGLEYLIYKKESGSLETSSYLKINYMGEISDYTNFKILFEQNTGPDIDSRNILDVLMEINILIVNGVVYCHVNYDGERIGEGYVDRFRNGYEKQLNDMMELFKTFDRQIVTPSDFALASVSQDELDSLFS